MKKHTLLLVLCSFILCLLAVVTVMTRLSPLEDTGWLAVGLYFISLFICASSLFTGIGAVLRMLLYKKETYFIHFLLALRQGMLLGGFVVGYVGLSILRVATWWNIVLLFLSILFVELYFLNRRSLQS